MTLKEYELLKYLIENKDIVLTRNQILGRVWGYDFDGETRTVDVHIRTLRQKLGDYGRYIETKPAKLFVHCYIRRGGV